MTLNDIQLNEDEWRIIRKAIESGEYANVNEVLTAGLRLLQGDDESYPWRRESLQLLAQAGFDQIDRGEYVELNSEDAVYAFLEDIEKEIARDKAV
jgi:Arc/MetJ-type ribon-helix-helix transcriptional regulator